MKFTHRTLLASAVLGAVFCSSAQASGEVGVFYYNLSDQFIAAFRDTLHTEKQWLKIDINEFTAQEDSLLQLQQAESLEPGTPMLVNLVDRNHADDIVELARSRKSRVVFFNREPSRAVVKSYDNAFYVGSDPVMAGVLQGEMISKYIKDHPKTDRNGDGRIEVVLIKGEENHQDTEQRMQNTIATLRKNDIRFEQTASLRADWSQEKAFNEMEKLLTRNGIDSIELVISNNDAMALGAVQSLSNNGYNAQDKDRFIPVFGIDAIPDALRAIDEGRMVGTVQNDAQTMSRIALKLAASKSEDRAVLSKEIGFEIDEDGFVKVPFRAVVK